FKEKMKELPIGQFGGKYLDLIEASLSGKVKHIESAQGEMGMEFQELKNFIRLAQLSGNNTLAQKGIQIAENYLTILDNINAGLGQSYRNFFYDK
ncbi:MAG: hypothetical protein RR034_02505, partial [Bacteroidales bacterium]